VLEFWIGSEFYWINIVFVVHIMNQPDSFSSIYGFRRYPIFLWLDLDFSNILDIPPEVAVSISEIGLKDIKNCWSICLLTNWMNILTWTVIVNHYTFYKSYSLIVKMLMIFFTGSILSMLRWSIFWHFVGSYLL